MSERSTRPIAFDMPASLRSRLEAMYAEPQRTYHTQMHVDALLQWLSHWRFLARDAWRIETAVWFHDAVYEPRRADNEVRSAALARTELAALGWAEGDVDRVVAMVLATERHDASQADADTLLFLDLDLSILAQAPVVYERYRLAVRDEYAWVEESAYRKRRAAVLRGFIDRDEIYRRPELQAVWEQSARSNLARELELLGAV
jgi:predicted metal-dependent HD superfamily phosphohydrolase